MGQFFENISNNIGVPKGDSSDRKENQTGKTFDISSVKELSDIFGNLRQTTVVGSCGVRPLLSKNRDAWNECVEKQANLEKESGTDKIATKKRMQNIIIISVILLLATVTTIVLVKRKKV